MSITITAAICCSVVFVAVWTDIIRNIRKPADAEPMQEWEQDNG